MWELSHQTGLLQHQPSYTGRAATVVIAASNASAKFRAQADYICNGVNDDVPIQLAIDNLPSSGGCVLLSEGRFVLGNTVHLNRQLTFRGLGVGATLIVAKAALNKDLFDVSSARVALEDFIIDGSKADQTSGHGINWLSGSENRVHMVEVNTCKQDGLHIGGTAYSVFMTHVKASSNLGHGCYIGSAGASCMGANGVFNANTLSGLYVDGAPECWFVNISGDQNTVNGIRLKGTQITLTGFWCGENGQAGLNCDTLNSSAISNGVVQGNSKGLSRDEDVFVNTCLYCTFSGIESRTPTVAQWENLLGFNIQASHKNTFLGCNVYKTTASADGITMYSANNNIFLGCVLDVPGKCLRLLDNTVLNNSFVAMRYLTGTTMIALEGGSVASDNYFQASNILAPGEVRVASGALTAGNANAYAFNWQNPFSTKILIKRVMIYLSTAGGTAGSLLDVGVAASTATPADTLIDGLGINTTGVFDNLNDAGTNGKSRQIVDENAGANDWVTGQILVANAASLVGRYEIEYVAI